MMNSFLALKERLAARSDHPHFIGPPMDISGLAPEEFGVLWPLLHVARYDGSIAPARREQMLEALRQAARCGLAPRLGVDELLATLDTVPKPVIYPAWIVRQVRFLAAPPVGASAAALEAALEAVLPPPEDWVRERRALLAIARACGAESILARLRAVLNARGADDLATREVAALEAVSLPALFALADSGHYYSADLDGADEPEPAPLLAGEPAYVGFARSALEGAAARLARLHAGALPYESDRAFDRDDALVLEMAARVAATRDETWYAGLITDLLCRACVAPTTARTAPSQALTIALGTAIAEVPTPESVAALRQALAVVRHAGLQKKLARHQKPAERALAQRPEVALRLLDAGLAPKQLRSLLTAFFEASFVQPIALPYAAWRTRLLADKTAAAFARSLVWRAGVAFMLDKRDQPLDANGQPCAIAGDAEVRLWHPLDANEAGREAWRGRIEREQLRQPLRQVFREFYQPADGALFQGVELAALPLLGLARREGWKLEYDCLVRRFGELRVEFGLSGRIYPGHAGVVGSGALRFCHGAAAVALADVPPRVLSEACRAVDLLVSVAAVALESDDPSWERSRRVWMLAGQGGRDVMRRAVLMRVLAPHIAAGSVRIEGFHVHVAGAMVSVRTGRVQRNGAALDIAPAAAGARLGAVPWLPYDEVLIERVLHCVGTLLDTGA